MNKASGQPKGLGDAERMVWIRSRLAATRGDDVRLRSLLVAVHESLRRRLAGEVDSAPPLSDLVVEPFEEISDYAAFVEQVCAAAEAEVPDGAQVLVVSRGDSDLLRLEGRTTGHFPQGRSGEWAGFYPADGQAAVGHLEDLLLEGYEFLVFPASSRWWLACYRELASFLAARGRLVHHGPACTIFAPGVESLEEAAA
jgi:hypothetical protein